MMKKNVELIKIMLTTKMNRAIIKPKNKSHTNVYREEVYNFMDIKTIANFLIQKFWYTRVDRQRIKCTRTKIGKLLTIVQILAIKYDGQAVFKDDIVEETCGTSIPILSIYRYPYDIWELLPARYRDSSLYENNAPIGTPTVLNAPPPVISEVSIQIPEMYRLNDDLNDFYKTLINNVFMRFGAYDGYEIGKYINQFKEDICLEGLVCREKVVSWLATTDFSISNPIIEFIRNYTF